MSLAARFQGLFDVPASEVFVALEARYDEPHRRYHTLAHIEACLAELDRAGGLGEERPLELSLWWHDAIYDPTRPDNEAFSAELAAGHLAILSEPDTCIIEVQRLIRLTAGHRTEPEDEAGARLIAIDLSILGQQPEVYDAYAAAIRQEYRHVPESLYRPGRAQILRKFLSGPIFQDPDFAARYEAQARVNLEREIASLEG